MKKNYVPFAPALISFGLLLILTGCTDIFAPPVVPAKKSIRITVSDGSTTARTLLPSDPPAITKYILTFKETNDNETYGPLTINDDNFVEVDDLPDGDWTITAEGFVGSSTNPVAVGKSEEFTYTGDEMELTIDISPVMSGDDGTFYYNVTITATNIDFDPDVSFLNIRLFPAGTSSNIPLASGSNENTIPLSPGNYLMTFRLVKDNGAYAADSHIVHIYPAMVTKYEETFGDDVFSEWEPIIPGALGITRPVTENGPVTTATFTGTGWFTGGTITWEPDVFNSTGTPTPSWNSAMEFEAEIIYKATVTLNAEQGYRFSDTVTPWTNTGATSVTPGTNTGDTLTITVVFPETAVLGTDIIIIPEPLTVTVPATKVNTNTTTVAVPAGADWDYADGSIAWFYGTNTSHTGPFAADTVYRAVFNLTANTDYIFDDDTIEEWSVNGVDADGVEVGGVKVTASVSADGKTLTITVVFPETTPIQITPNDLNDYLTRPVKGDPINDTPPTPSAGDEYAITAIRWYVGDTTGSPLTVVPGDKFQPGTVYCAELDLEAGADYTFNGLDADSFDTPYTGPTGAVTHDAGTGIDLTVTIVFPKTAADTDTPVTPVPLTVTVPATKVNTNTTTVAVPAGADWDYADGSIAWFYGTNTSHTGPFAADTVYRAVFNLTANTDYIFDDDTIGEWSVNGVVADGVEVGGVKVTASVSADGKTLTITVVFPETTPIQITPNDLNDYLTRPVKGDPINDTPPTPSAGDEYAITAIRWYVGDTTGSPLTVVPGDKFQPGTVYCAELDLEAGADYTFNGLGADSFDTPYTGPTGAVTHDAGTGIDLTVTIVFPATQAPGDITGYSVTFKLDDKSGTIIVDPSTPITTIRKTGTPNEITFNANFPGGTDYTWYVDGVPVTTPSPTSLTVNANKYAIASHSVKLTAEIGGVTWSSDTINFTVAR